MRHLSLDYKPYFADRETEARRLSGFFSIIPEIKIWASLSPGLWLGSYVSINKDLRTTSNPHAHTGKAFLQEFRKNGRWRAVLARPDRATCCWWTASEPREPAARCPRHVGRGSLLQFQVNTISLLDFLCHLYVCTWVSRVDRVN